MDVEDVNGDVLIINNSDIRMVINTSANPSPSICDISVGYGEGLEKVERIITDFLPELKTSIPDTLE